MNAVILAAGKASRFVPLSEERPKGLLEVRGEVLIERQIKQLLEAGLDDITIILGYKAEQFFYLADKFGVQFVTNDDFDRYNNTSSMIRILDRLEDTFVCCSDHYFSKNVFKDCQEDSYYAALYAPGPTGEYCLATDANDWITSVRIGGADAWYLAGHAYFNRSFSERFKKILIKDYENERTRLEYWEDVWIRHIKELPLRLKKYSPGDIHEFDSIDELREFDSSYIVDTRSTLLKKIAQDLGCEERDLSGFSRISDTDGALRFSFRAYVADYLYDGSKETLQILSGGENPFDRDHLLRHLRLIFPGQDVSNVIIRKIGGMSNKNFRIDFLGKSYVLRVPGNGSEGMVERTNEEFNAMAACHLGVTPSIRYFNAQTGIKLADFVENAETLNAFTIQHQDNMRKIADIYRRIHLSNIRLKNEFNIFREIDKYDHLIEDASATMYPKWEMVKPRVKALEESLNELGIDMRPCHNDAVPENFIKATDETLFLIDWEYSGMNDPMADFAALFLESSFSEKNKEFILNCYFEGHIPDNAKKKIRIFEILWDTLWSQWTVIKEAKGDDFGSYGAKRYARAIKALDKLDDYGV